MNFKLRILVILLIAIGLPFVSVSAVHSVVEEEVTEDESTVAEDEDPEIENHLAERKKKKGKNLSNNESGFPKHVHTVKGADDDVVLELDE
jgi:hypothetical protein